MNNPTQNVTTSTPRKIVDIHNDLRLNLCVPIKDRSTDWEDSTSKLINLAYVDYLNQPDSKLAIETIVLISLAKKIGLNSSKKIAISLTRWKKEIPPSLSKIILDNEEKLLVYKLMSSITADWVTVYAISEIEDASSEALQKELINWGFKNSSDISSFFEIFGEKLLFEQHSLSILTNALKWMVKNNYFAEKLNVSPFPILYKLIADGLQHIKTADLSAKTRQHIISSLQEAVCEFINEVTSIDPTYLMSPTVARFIDFLGSQSKSWPKSTNMKLSNISKRLINLLTLQLPLLSTDSVEAFIPTMQSYKKSLPDFDRLFKLSFGQEINSLNWSSAKNVSKNNEYPLEEILLSLLPNWDAFLEKNSSNPEVNQIDFKINEVAKILGISKQGNLGEIVEFNPLKHKLLGSVSPIPINVKVVKTGLVVANKDGLSRVALKILVEAI
jgi:hypothetical protein